MKPINMVNAQHISALKLGNRAAKRGDYDQAIIHYQQALLEQPAMVKFIEFSISHARKKLAIQNTIHNANNNTIPLTIRTTGTVSATILETLKTEENEDFFSKQPKPSEIFDKEWYLRTYNYTDDGQVDWLEHYHATGWKRGEDPSPLFSNSAYLDSEEGLTEYFIASGQSSLSHYCAIGYEEKREFFHNPMISFQQSYQTSSPVIKFANKSQVNPFEKAAVFVHCYYIDIASEIIQKCIELNLDIYAAFIEDTEYSSLIDRYGETINYKVFPNRGRDIAPFVTGFKEELQQYEFALHLHTKKSLHYGSARSDWMGYCLESLLGNLAKVLDTFSKHKNASIIYPEPPDFLKEQMNWGHNFRRVEALMGMLGIEINPTDRLDFPAGSMFWFRTADLMPIFNLPISPYLFEKENGQVDGTLAHAFERLFGVYTLKKDKQIIPLRKSTSKYFSIATQASSKSNEIRSIRKTAETYNLSLRHFYPELTPFSFSAAPSSKPRINLLVPTVDPVHIFGGISTALDFYKSLAELCGVDARIITTDGQSSPLFLKSFPGYSCYSMRYCADEDLAQIVSGVPRSDGDLLIRENDIFVATSWWSANHLAEICKFQLEHYNKVNQHIYLVQDYEPHFYGWSSKSQLADATYFNDWIKVYNTELLHEYFEARKKSHGKSFVLKPHLNASIEAELIKLDGLSKENIVLVYGRPFAERNCNEILLEAISIWKSRDKSSADWKIISLGQEYEHVLIDELGIQVLGKVSLEAYAELLAKAKIGISLMVSPHPSYPPYEMLASGLKTYTNTYDNKNSICKSGNLHMGSGSPHDIADFLSMNAENLRSRSTYSIQSLKDADFGSGLSMSRVISDIKDQLLIDSPRG
ncbi:hypothetical protein I5O09_17460 [Pseudomonas parafulva]|uniref:rhamnosyltransferase WsaF family glycosyltransferase n=1 Tax=Pseudomonas parafulva TaxID=157782 RepID=UPI0018D7417D|nr:rhamnan synthesis F family protein [Pseudomonas parafulva]MBH3345531.1 hypothetical protein [Pseudomonas parafulva]